MLRHINNLEDLLILNTICTAFNYNNITHQKQLKYKIMTSIRKLTVCSYNMRGFNSSKINYVTDLLGRYDILLLQEHWFK